jgi:hypothetical protein
MIMPQSTNSNMIAPQPLASPPVFELYKEYAQTVEKVSDRRANLNSWMITLLNIVLASDGGMSYLLPAHAGSENIASSLIIPLAGIVTSLIWLALLRSYRQLNQAKFEVLFDFEDKMGVEVFRLERKRYKQIARTGFSKIERYVPVAFIALFALVFLSRLSG